MVATGFPFIMAFAAIITVFFYLSVPFVAGAIMKGLSGTTAALQAGIQGTMQAAGVAIGTGLTAAGAAATLGGSTTVQGALAGAQVATGAASAAGRLVGAVSGSSDVPAPPPIPSVSSGGDSVSNPDNPGPVAHQTAPNAFAVVDNVFSSASMKGHLKSVTAFSGGCRGICGLILTARGSWFTDDHTFDHPKIPVNVH